MSDSTRICDADSCDVCGRIFGEGDTVIDGKTIHGPWGTMCQTCHGMMGVGLGTGKGQSFVKGNPLKVEG
jgi:hypothetical protein